MLKIQIFFIELHNLFFNDNVYIYDVGLRLLFSFEFELNLANNFTKCFYNKITA